MDLKKAIRESYIAQGLDERHLEKLYRIAQVRRFEDGKPLMSQGDLSQDLFVVVEGRANVLSVTGEVIGSIKPGMPVGEISFLDGKARSVSVISDGGCEAAVVSGDELWRVLDENHDLAYRVLINVSRVLCARMRSANKNIATLLSLEESDFNGRL